MMNKIKKKDLKKIGIMILLILYFVLSTKPINIQITIPINIAGDAGITILP